MKRFPVWLVLGVSSCGSPQPVAPEVPGNAPARASVAELLARAERANAEHLPLDYARPFERASVPESPAVALYLDACRAGDKRACWLAMQLAEQDAVVSAPLERAPAQISSRWREALKLVEANCMGGDRESCRALPADADARSLSFPTAPGLLGRSRRCSESDTLSGCSETLLRSECDAGFVRSCRALSGLLVLRSAESAKPHELVDEAEAIAQRADHLGADDCNAGIVATCTLEEAVVAGSELVCSFGRQCSTLAQSYLRQGDTRRARDAAERDCQYFANRCAELGVMYLDGTLPEPVVGRGQALVDFVCASYRRSAGEHEMRQYTPCERAKLPADGP